MAQVLQVNARRETGRKAQMQNISAAKAVADVVRTTLGPRSMLKMILDASGGIVMTNDGNAILREIDVTRCINEVQQIVLTVRCTVGECNRVALDGNAPFTLDVHRVEHLVAELTLRNATTGLDQPIGQSRLTMINMGDNAKIPNMFHT